MSGFSFNFSFGEDESLFGGSIEAKHTDSILAASSLSLPYPVDDVATAATVVSVPCVPYSTEPPYYHLQVGKNAFKIITIECDLSPKVGHAYYDIVPGKYEGGNSCSTLNF